MIDVEDRWALTELVYRYGQAVDDRNWAALGDVFTPDAVFDVSAIGGPVHTGLDHIAEHLAQRTIPTAHLFANVVVDDDPDATEQPAAIVRAKGMTPNPEGCIVVASVRYHARKVDGQWRFLGQWCDSLVRPGPEMRR